MFSVRNCRGISLKVAFKSHKKTGSCKHSENSPAVGAPPQTSWGPYDAPQIL